MKTKNIVFCLLLTTLFSGVSCLLSSYSFPEKADSFQTGGEDFQPFLQKFTSSAAFQMTRIKFPLKTPIVLMAEDGEHEKSFPFTKEKWSLLDPETMKEEDLKEEGGAVYTSKFTVNDPTRKEFISGYDESELDLHVVFELIDGKWYVTDCYTSWYAFDLPANELQQTIQQVKEENEAFREIHP